MRSNDHFEFGAECLSAVGVVAAWRRSTKEHKVRSAPMLIVSQCSSTDEGAYSPGADVTILGVSGLLALRGAIDEALRYETP